MSSPHQEHSRRDVVARFAARLGLTRLGESIPRPGALLVINYHRIGDWWEAPYDRDVYSATADLFEQQVRYLRRRFHIASLDEAVDLVSRRRPFVGLAVLLTFNDGYIDNYRVAFPILRALGVPATFFLVTSMMGSHDLPWWDRLGFAVRLTTRSSLNLNYPRRLNVDLRDRDAAVRAMTQLYKSPLVDNPERFLQEVVTTCDTDQPRSRDRLFLNWEEALEMIQGGMDIGSHTHTHSVLTKLSPDQQLDELRMSRTLLQDRLSVPISSLAYPVGAFDDASLDALELSGYVAAFSSRGGLNKPADSNRFDVRRVAAEHDVGWSRFRLQCVLAPYLSGYWF